MNITTRSKKAFTLLEMVAVLVLILVLAGIAVPTYQAVIGETRQTAAVLSATALRNYGDAYAATQQVPPSTFQADFYEMACDDLPGCGSGVAIRTLINLTTLTIDDGQSAETCATILWSTEVGGSSEVQPCYGPDEWTDATVSGTLTFNGTAMTGVQATLLKFDWGINNFAPVCKNGSIDPVPSGMFYCTDPGQGGTINVVTNSLGQYSLTIGPNQLHGAYMVAGTRLAPPYTQGFGSAFTVRSGDTRTSSFNIGS